MSGSWVVGSRCAVVRFRHFASRADKLPSTSYRHQPALAPLSVARSCNRDLISQLLLDTLGNPFLVQKPEARKWLEQSEHRSPACLGCHQMTPRFVPNVPAGAACAAFTASFAPRGAKSELLFAPHGHFQKLLWHWGDRPAAGGTRRPEAASKAGGTASKSLVRPTSSRWREQVLERRFKAGYSCPCS